MSKETSSAVGKIGSILHNFSSHHGVVDVFSNYPIRDIAASIIALSRLQGIDENSQDIEARLTKLSSDCVGENMNGYPNLHVEKGVAIVINNALLDDLAWYAKFATAAYGWGGRLAFRRLQKLGGNVGSLCRATGIKREDVVDANWKSKTHLPVRSGKGKEKDWGEEGIKCFNSFITFLLISKTLLLAFTRFR